MLKKLPRPAILAHRGSSLDAPENTISAFNLAIQQGAHAIELDAMLSADRQVVVIHDHTVDRTTNGSGKVREMNLVDLQALDAGSYIGAEYRGEKIPSLEDVLSQLGGKILFNIELKNFGNPLDDLPKIIAEMVTKCSLENDVLFSSFNPLALMKVRMYLPGVHTGFLVGNGLLGKISRFLTKYVPHQALHPNLAITTPELIERVHSNGRRIHVYTIDDGKTMRKLYAMGVDGIFTNDPASAKEVIDTM